MKGCDPFWNLSISSNDPLVGEPWDQAIKTWIAGISEKQRNLYWITSKSGNKASALDKIFNEDEDRSLLKIAAF